MFSMAEGWSYIKGLYFVTVTLTTIGLGDVVPTTELGEDIHFFYCAIGLGLIAVLISSTSEFITKTLVIISRRASGSSLLLGTTNPERNAGQSMVGADIPSADGDLRVSPRCSATGTAAGMGQMGMNMPSSKISATPPSEITRRLSGHLVDSPPQSPRSPVSPGGRRHSRDPNLTPGSITPGSPRESSLSKVSLSANQTTFSKAASSLSLFESPSSAKKSGNAMSAGVGVTRRLSKPKLTVQRVGCRVAPQKNTGESTSDTSDVLPRPGDRGNVGSTMDSSIRGSFVASVRETSRAPRGGPKPVGSSAVAMDSTVRDGFVSSVRESGVAQSGARLSKKTTEDSSKETSAQQRPAEMSDRNSVGLAPTRLRRPDEIGEDDGGMRVVLPGPLGAIASATESSRNGALDAITSAAESSRKA